MDENYRTKRDEQIDRVFMHMAEDISSLSHAKKAQVGALLVSERNILAYGFNGTPSGMDNDAEFVLEDGTLKTKPETLHAESNAIAKIAMSTQSSSGSTMYVTMCPCMACSKLMIQAGVVRVVYKDDYRDHSGIELLGRCGIRVDRLL